MPENEVTVYIMIRFYLFIIIMNYIFKNKRKCKDVKILDYKM